MTPQLPGTGVRDAFHAASPMKFPRTRRSRRAVFGAAKLVGIEWEGREMAEQDVEPQVPVIDLSRAPGERTAWDRPLSTVLL